jgi:hypothetical protein
MTRDEYLECLRDLTAEVNAAQERGDEDGRLGAVMALDAFLSVVRPPQGMGVVAPHVLFTRCRECHTEP